MRGEAAIELGEAAEARLLDVLSEPPTGVLHALLDAALLPAGRDVAGVRLRRDLALPERNDLEGGENVT